VDLAETVVQAAPVEIAVVLVVVAVEAPAVVVPAEEARIRAKATLELVLNCSKRQFLSIAAPRWLKADVGLASVLFL
jgi:hypothetical protein